MPAPVRIGALVAILALLVPAAALAQSGGGAGDSQYQDPFGSSTPAKPSKPSAPARQQPAQQQTQTAPAPSAPAAQSAAQSTAPPSQAQRSRPSAQTLPRTGFDVLPVAAAGLLLLLGGLALRRRPHGER